MSIADSISKSMQKSTSSILSSPSSATSSSSADLGMDLGTSASWTDFSAFTWKGWLLVIFILAILGINIFAILGRGADEANSIFGPIIKKITALFVGTTGQIVGTSAVGAKAVIDNTTDVADKTLAKIADAAVVGGTAPTAPPNPARKGPVLVPPEPQGTDVMPPDHGPVPGPGYCYLGSGDPFRTCAQVGYQDLCMSGEVFPTHDQCVNPAMR